MEPLHDDEADTGLEVVLDLLRSQAPHLAALSLARISGTAGNTGSDNVLYRLGTELVVRLPRTPSAAASMRTETRLLPPLAGRLPVALPELVHVGSASARYPHPWAVLRWLPGRAAGRAGGAPCGEGAGAAYPEAGAAPTGTPVWAAW